MTTDRYTEEARRAVNGCDACGVDFDTCRREGATADRDTPEHEIWCCPECQHFCRALGLGGACPHCDDPILLAELLGMEVLP